MDIAKVKELIALIETSGLSALDLREGNDRLRLRRDVVSRDVSLRTEQRAAVTMPASAEPVSKSSEPRARVEGNVVASPMVGMFYRRASADAAPFV
jgi:acetyl-CoA carboxylase biotin carboxyl carrier protein